MDLQQFQNLAQTYSTVPVYRKVLSDLLTPVSAYLHLARDAKYAVLLESVEKGRHYARFSFIGRNPSKILTQKNDRTIIEIPGEGETTATKSFFDVLREHQNAVNIPQLPEIPLFSGGWVGYMGYETIRWAEDVPVHTGDSDYAPDAIFMLFDTLIAFDHLKHETIISTNVSIDQNRSLRAQYDKAQQIIEEVIIDLQQSDGYMTTEPTKNYPLTSNMSQAQFESAVEKAREHIIAGDVFQLVLSQRFERRSDSEPFSIYRALRSINPSPFMYYLQLNDFQIIGASPELLVGVENRCMEVRPIAGTRPRGLSDDEDTVLQEELLADEKERAEHLMLVDLSRNDVGRVCEYGSVQMESFMEVEKYSHVMHIVSDVQGKLLDKYDAFEALMAGFPAGTVSGAPKIRAMELIHELEPDRRGIYSGAVGYLDFHGNLTTCIAIRTLQMKDDLVSFQSGAGIVYDSIPENEYEETHNKARAIMRAIDYAERGLQ